jgi:hypothetical protein
LTNEQLIREVCQDEAFIKNLLTLETPQEVQAALRGRGVEMSVEEIKAIREMLIKKLDSGAELSEAELAEVTGGEFVILTTSIILTMLLFGAGAGGLAGGTAAGLVGIGVLVANVTNNTW